MCALPAGAADANGVNDAAVKQLQARRNGAVKQLEAQAAYMRLAGDAHWWVKPTLRVCLVLRADGKQLIDHPWGSSIEYRHAVEEKVEHLRMVIAFFDSSAAWRKKIEGERRESYDQFAKSRKADLPPSRLDLRHRRDCSAMAPNSKRGCDCELAHDPSSVGVSQAWILNVGPAAAERTRLIGVKDEFDPVWEYLGALGCTSWDQVTARSLAEGYSARCWNAYSAMAARMVTFEAGPIPASAALPRRERRELKEGYNIVRPQDRLAYVATKRAVSRRGRDASRARQAAVGEEWTGAEADVIGPLLAGKAVAPGPALARFRSAKLIGSASEPYYGRLDRPSSKGWDAYKPSITRETLERILSDTGRGDEGHPDAIVLTRAKRARLEMRIVGMRRALQRDLAPLPDDALGLLCLPPKLDLLAA